MAVKRKKPFVLKWLLITTGVTLGAVGLVILCAPWISVQGVPLSIVLKFLADEPARTAFFAKDSQTLHDRLNQLNVEEEIKAFYRPQFSDEMQLDQHIHQIFYDVSGYVGESYVATSQGTLVRKNWHFESWVKLAKRAGVITESRYGADGTALVTTAQGTVVRFRIIASVYPPKFLRQLIKNQQK